MNAGQRRIWRRAILAAAVHCGLAAVHRGAQAAPRNWVGNNADWLDGAGNNANWNPADEPDAADEAIFSTANSVNLGSANSISALTLSGGIDLNTNGFNLNVNGLVQVSGAATNLIVGGSASALNADAVTINLGGTLELSGGALNIAEETGNGLLTIAANGLLAGNGTINMNDGLTAQTTLIVNNGTLSARSDAVLGVPRTGTLSINAANATNARIELDGAAGNGVVNVFRNQTLDINVPIFDPFSGDINLFHNSVLDISSNWVLDAGGTIDVDNGGISVPFVPAGTAFIRGAIFTQSSGAITVVDGDGALQFDAPFHMNGGALVNNGEVIFNADADIGPGAQFTMPGGTSSLTVNAGHTVTVNQANFNADGIGSATNVITIHGNGALRVNLGAGADDNFGGTLNLPGGTLSVTTTDNVWDLTGIVNTVAGTGTSTLDGETVHFNAAQVSVGVGTALLVDAASTFGAGSTFGGPGTLVIEGNSTFAADTLINNSRFDWDGVFSTASHTINDGVTLTITAGSMDAMREPVTIGGAGATLNVNVPGSWSMIAPLNTNPANTGTAVIGGSSRMMLSGAGADFNVNGDTTVETPVTFGAGSTTTVAAGAELLVAGDATYGGGIITGPGSYTPPAVNVVNSNTTIQVANFDFDGGTWAVNSAATLTVDVVDYDLDVGANYFREKTISLNGGSILVNTGESEFVFDGTLNLAGASQTWSGEPLDIGLDLDSVGGKINANAGISIFNSDIDFNADAEVNVASAATLVLAGEASFTPSNAGLNAKFTGAGALVLEGPATFAESTTINMVGGTIDLDGRDSDLDGNAITVLAPTVINAASVPAFGGKANTTGTNILQVDHVGDTGSLTVNLDSPSAAWTIGPFAVVNLMNGNAPETLLGGSAINMFGTMNVSGDVRVESRMVITGPIHLNSPGEPLRLSGGDLRDANANRIAGSTINGSGILGADTDTALYGYGTIDVDVDFDGTASLRADDAMLTLNGRILDVNFLGTADADGILNVTAPWNTSVTGVVDLQGGELRGAAITNDNVAGIMGRGLISARVINNSRVNAAGGELVLQTAANDNDWDGSTNTGALRAATGNLVLRDNAAFPFRGSVTAESGFEVIADGFELDFEPGSALNLNGGAYRQSTEITTHLGGAVNVGAGADSKLATGTYVFEPTSTTSLAGNLQLDADSRIQAGATFTGAGLLINLPNRGVFADDAANINVLLENRGRLQLGGFDAGRVSLREYRQSSAGTLYVELGGTGPDQFDRLTISGSAELAGTLRVELVGSYLPEAVGQSYELITAAGGVSGSFSTVVRPDSGPSLHFTPTYGPTAVTLTLTRAYYNVLGDTHPNNYGGIGYELIKLRPTTATLTGNNTYTGLTTVSEGMLVFANHQSLGDGGLDIRAGAVAQFARDFSQAARVTGLSIEQTGALDITNNKFVIAGGDATAVLDLVKSGYNAGAWNGNGILSTAADSSTAIAVARAADVGLAGGTFGGVPVTADDVLVMYTLYGDADFSGAVDFNDLARLAQNYNTSDKVWHQGDFTYDGIVDFNDLAKMAQNYNTSLPASPIPGASAAFEADWAAAMAAVPEPATIALLAFATIPRRRRR
jgi:autotransporter-associated beta strand protein